MGVYHVTLIGDPYRCWRCKAVATVALVKRMEDGAISECAYCDECWIAETRAYQPLISGDKRRATQEAERILGDDEQKAGVRV